jgi:hypothetical protein
MPNGKPGDHPHSDIVIHGMPTFTPEIDALVRDVEALGGFRSVLATDWLAERQAALWRANKENDETRRQQVLSWAVALLERERTRLRRLGL